MPLKTYLTRLPIARRILLTTLVAGSLTAVGLAGTLSHQANAIAVAQADDVLAAEVNLVEVSLNLASTALKESGTRALARLEAHLGNISIDPSKAVQTGGTPLPEVRIDGTLANGATAALQEFARNGSGEGEVLALHEGQLYRALTLQQNAQGQSLAGDRIPETEAYARALLDGKPFSRVIQRNGKAVVLSARPLSNKEGKVVGGLVLQQESPPLLASLMAELKTTKIGKTGYIYAIAPSAGDALESLFTLHPKLEGKPISEIKDPVVVSLLTRMAKEPAGKMVYDWPDAEGKALPKIVQFKSIPELGVAVAAGTYIHEFAEQLAFLQHLVLAICSGAGVTLLLLLAFVVRKSLHPFQAVVASVEALGHGDLRVALPTKDNSRDEADLVSAGLNKAAQEVSHLVSSIQGAGQAAAGISAQLSTSAGQIAKATATQSEAALNMSSATEQLSVAIDEVAGNAEQAREAAHQAQIALQGGQAAVSQVVSSIQKTTALVQGAATQAQSLGESTEAIRSITGSIQAIAEQTNLLALNAAIEAARAGDSGRGFAVVADEVRKLAEKSARSAAEINQIIATVSSAVAEVTAEIQSSAALAGQSQGFAREAQTAFSTIDTASAAVVSYVDDIAGSVKEQSAAAHDIASRVEHVASAAEQIGTMARDNQGAVGHLAEQVENLRTQSLRFTVR